MAGYLQAVLEFSVQADSGYSTVLMKNTASPLPASCSISPSLQFAFCLATDFDMEEIQYHIGQAENESFFDLMY